MTRNLDIFHTRDVEGLRIQKEANKSLFQTITMAISVVGTTLPRDPYQKHYAKKGEESTARSPYALAMKEV